MLKVDGLTRLGLEPVSFTLALGDCVAVRGPSGSGKTLLLRAIADLDPCGGDVSLGGEDRNAMPAPSWRRRVGYVPAEPGWWALTAREHFAANDARLGPLLERLRLDPGVLDREIAHLSTGERQRLALIRALLLDPEVLLLDEPTGALDRDAIAAVESLVAELRQRGVAVVWVTHDDAQAHRVASHSLMVANGRVSAEAMT